MLIEALMLLAASGASSALPHMFSAPVYSPQQRQVSNWRMEALQRLDLDLARTRAILTADQQTRLPRCIRLNNYWCIKSARWNGEIATDSEGHVAFVNAHEGALVAVNLLRRYYLEFNRKSALSIVSRWAPAQCGGGAMIARTPRIATTRADALTTRGIRNTARAKFLARHGRGGVARPVARQNRTAATRNVQRAPRSAALRVDDMMRAPSIAAGLGERAPVQSIAIASLAPLPARGAKAEPAVPRIACTGEALRIRNYAARIAAAAGLGPTDDLQLFAADGMAHPRLRDVMLAMAAVEIGPYGARAALVEQAIARANGRFAGP
ncbi:MAG: hypothetical protein FJX29_10605 [Alphaproteobacteria bacterium]|nr:hypothetical protein [Alphaproteobacteria bacterium]